MKSLQMELPFWVRAVLLAMWQTVRRGSEPKQVVFRKRGIDLTIESPVRLKVVNSGSVLDAAKAFASGQVDLAVVRADVGDLSQARTIAMTAHGVVMIVAPPGSSVTSIAKLRDHTVGVVGGEINHGVVEVLKKEYDLGRANVTFKDIAPADVRRAVQAKEVAALLLVTPLTDRYLSFVKGLFREGANSQPTRITIEKAGATADLFAAGESFDIPKGTLRGAPPVPDDDVTTLRVGYYLVANRHLNATVAADLARKIMAVRRDLVGEEPLLSGLAAPELDADAYLAVHPGAAAFFNGTQESFMDRYGNAFPIDAFDAPSIFATTRKLIASNRPLVMNVMQGFVETIHLFKTQPEIVVPLLQRYVKIDDRRVAEDLYAYHVPVFQKIPRPSFAGMQTLREYLVAKYPAAASLKESDIADPSLIDELERSGFIDRLYAADTK